MIPAGIPEPKLDHLYQEVILDHNRSPRNFVEITDADAHSHGLNPLCGDEYHIYMKISKEGTIDKIGFKGSGCAISKSSASIMTTLIHGKNLLEAGKIKRAFIDFMTKESISSEQRALLDRMSIFEGVKEFPVRVKCATLIWRTLEDAIKQYEMQNSKISYRMFEKGASVNPIQLSAEMTPNPNTIKFITNQAFLASGSFDFPTVEKAKDSALAQKLFEIETVKGVLIGTNFITVTKSPHADWQEVAPYVSESIQQFFASGEEPIAKELLAQTPQTESGNSEIEQRIRQILDEEIRPAVARDGGDIIFYSFKEGVVTLHLQGSCSSCPSSIMTLKMGVEHRLRQAIPEVKEVVQV